MTWRKLSSEWSVIFTVAVVAFFGLSAIEMPSLASTSSEEPSAEAAVQAGATQVEVHSFRIDQTDTGLEANVTLEVHNNSGSNIDFRADQVVLVQAGSSSSWPSQLSADSVAVSPDRGVVVPLSFDVAPVPGASYRLEYAGQTIFAGQPVAS
jgi:hypothetical protein